MISDNKKTDMSVRRFRGVRYAYGVSLLMLTLTGFGQMPIFKRYYIADIPGLGWLAQFFVTHYLHYLFGIVFIFLAVYVTADYWVHTRTFASVSATGSIKAGLLFGLLITGVFMVFRNFPAYHFPAELIIAVNILHLALVMALLAFTLFSAVFGKKWLSDNSAAGKGA